MSNVLLPPQAQNATVALALQKRLMKEHNISIVYGSVPATATHSSSSSSSSCNNDTSISSSDSNSTSASTAQLTFFVRLSAQVYLDISDFELLADCALNILKEVAV